MKSNDENFLFLDLALISSCYLVCKFNTNIYILFALINIPLFIAINEKRKVCALLMSIFISFFIVKNISIYFIFVFIIYLLVVILLINISYKRCWVYAIINASVILLFSIILSYDINYVLALISFVLFYVSYDFVTKQYYYLKKITKMYGEYDKSLNEKALYQSLFKISHEIKNPLAVCKGYLDMFDSKDTIKKKKYISIIKEEINRTIILLKDFSNFSKLKIKKKNVLINKFLNDICDEAKFLYKNNIVVESFIDPNAINIKIDENRIKQVLINAIKNAKEAIEKDGIIKISSKVKKRFYEITIIDNGSGMDSETLRQIGTPFYTTKKEGTGLGVCLSKEIIEAHGGIIKYKSKKNQGTTLIIKIPLVNNKSV